MQIPVMNTLNQVSGNPPGCYEELGCTYPNDSSDLPCDSRTIQSIQVLKFLTQLVKNFTKFLPGGWGEDAKMC